MIEGWKKVQVLEICTKGSSNIAQNKIEDNFGEYPLYGASGFLKKIDFYHQEKPYIGIVKDGSGVGRVGFYPAKSSLLGTLQYILPKEGYDIRFVGYALKSLDLASFSTGAAIPHIYFKDYGKSFICVPPTLEEQERVVNELDLLTGIIDKKNAQLRDLDALSQAIFYEMFGDPITNDKGWPKRMLKQLGLVITGNTPSTKDVKNYASEDVCFFKPSDICKDSVSFLKKSEFHISSYAFEKSRKLPKGSVLTTCIGIVGKVGILTESATCNQQINAIIPENVESPWLAYAVFLQKKLMEGIANAPVVPIINKGDFSRIQVPVPPIEKQEQFSQALKEIECRKQMILLSKSETEKLLSCRMASYFG